MQERLPGLRAGRVAERQLVLAAPQPVPARLQLHAPAVRELAGVGEFVEDDGVVAHGGADDAPAVRAQLVDQPREVIE
ncbi:hypothetical protein [Actinocatenispora thailandica]|nr:hypothetical protein [Actinocatenispora thailandica]